jgi:hypothetical protein
MAGIAELEEVRRNDPEREFSDRAAAAAKALVPDSASLAVGRYKLHAVDAHSLKAPGFIL